MEKIINKNTIISKILLTNEEREKLMYAYFNPVTGEGSILERSKVEISDFPMPVQYLPKEMMKVPLVKLLIKAGSLKKFYESNLAKEGDNGYDDDTKQTIIDEFVRTRFRYDFCFWAATMVFIKAKGGGDDCRFRLNRCQRRLVTAFERRRIAGKPIRIILLKARQWGGSTCTQMYFAWLQLIHKVGLNSLIVSHVKDTSIEILDMFDRMLKHYPVSLLHDLGDSYTEKEDKWTGVGNSGNIHRIPQRNCKVKIGSAEKPDSARGGDYNLVHCSEVALWKKTEGKSPADIVRSACSGILLKPYTMIVYESTANGVGNFFQIEYDAAKNGKSQFDDMFVAWYEIEQYEMSFANDDERADFAIELYKNRENGNTFSDREESGKYLWWLWERGASLEAIHWYIEERKKYTDHGQMASEYPSDDIEAFVNSGARVFDRYKVEKFRKGCRKPLYVGDVYGKMEKGKNALKGLRFSEDSQGLLWIWNKPEADDGESYIKDRYLTVVDVGGRSNKADWSVIVVFDRLFMKDGDKPVVVAQWYGHIDIDLLAWKAAQIAAYYNNSLLVIESNTLETKDRDRIVDGDQSLFILNQIKGVYNNLYARRQSEDEIKEGMPVKYGFHTNVSTKPMIISTLIEVIREHSYVERDERCLDEYLCYERKQNGAFGAIIGKHDDLLMTRAIGLHICFFEMELPKVVKCSSRIIKARRAISAATIG